MAAVKRRKDDEELPQEPKAPVAPPSLEMQVLKVLGTPPNYYKTQIVNVGDCRWRANVRVHCPSNNCVTVSKIAHSFYLKTDDKGKITGGDEIVPTYK